LDFADELDRGTDAGISKEFLTLRDRTIRNLMITRRIFFMNFWGAGRLDGNETFDFISVLIRITNRIQEFLNRILPLRDRDNCTNVVGSAALTEFCCLRVQRVISAKEVMFSSALVCLFGCRIT